MSPPGREYRLLVRTSVRPTIQLQPKQRMKCGIFCPSLRQALPSRSAHRTRIRGDSTEVCVEQAFCEQTRVLWRPRGLARHFCGGLQHSPLASICFLVVCNISVSELLSTKPSVKSCNHSGKESRPASQCTSPCVGAPVHFITATTSTHFYSNVSREISARLAKMWLNQYGRMTTRHTFMSARSTSALFHDSIEIHISEKSAQAKRTDGRCVKLTEMRDEWHHWRGCPVGVRTHTTSVRIHYPPLHPRLRHTSYPPSPRHHTQLQSHTRYSFALPDKGGKLTGMEKD